MSFTPLHPAESVCAADPVLRPLLQARSHRESVHAVERLLKQCAYPIIEAAVHRHVMGAPVYVRGEAAEVRAETVYRLLQRLDPTKNFREPIRDFRAYVKTTASHVCWNRREAALRQIPCAALYDGTRTASGQTVTMDFDDSDSEPGLAEALFAPGDIPTKLERGQIMVAVWEEVQRLPHAQRVALLLHFRVSDGRSGILALLQEGNANISEVASALGLPVAEVETLLNCLPLDDAAIGVRLQRSAHQVNNLRGAARRRITRRLREWIE